MRELKQLVTSVKRTIYVRMDDGDDLIALVRETAKREGIRTGCFTAIGALTKVRFAVYSIEKQRYEDIELEGYYEFTSVVGNIATVMDEKGEAVDLFVHAHINLAGHDGRVYGGHLREMSSIALGEIVICETEGGVIKRMKDELDRRGYSPFIFEQTESPSEIEAHFARKLSGKRAVKRPVVTREDVLKVGRKGEGVKEIRVPTLIGMVPT